MVRSGDPCRVDSWVLATIRVLLKRVADLELSAGPRTVCLYDALDFRAAAAPERTPHFEFRADAPEFFPSAAVKPSISADEDEKLSGIVLVSEVRHEELLSQSPANHSE